MAVAEQLGDDGRPDQTGATGDEDVHGALLARPVWTFGHILVSMETDEARVDFLSTLWSNFAEREAGPYSPLYAAIARAVAADRRLIARVIEDAPPAAHMPITLLAAVHDLVLREPSLPLAVAYNEGAVAIAPQRFVELCDVRWPDVVEVLQHRRVQTNECGRSAPIALALAKVTEAAGPLDGLVDAGASAGLNLLYDRFCLDYGAFGCLGNSSSAVRVACEVSRAAGLPAAGRRAGHHDPGRARPRCRSTSPTRPIADGCWRARGPTPGGWSAPRRLWPSPRRTRRMSVVAAWSPTSPRSSTPFPTDGSACSRRGPPGT